MFKVAICDSDYFYRNKIADLTMKTLFDTVEIAFHYYKTGMEIMDAVLGNLFAADLLFIDIELPKIDGLKTVQFLRQFGIRSDIVFVTEAIEYSLEGYRYGTFDFIQKPIAPTEFERVMLRYAKERIQRNPDFFDITVRGGFCRINLRHVMYFESRGRKITAVEREGKISFYLKMDDLERQIREQRFIRIHQSYLVNINYVSFVSASMVILSDGTNLPVSKRYKIKVREAFRLPVLRGIEKR